MNKKSFRKESLERLKKVQSRVPKPRDHHLLDTLYDMIKKEKANTILLYIPLKIEVNINPLIVRLRREKRSLYVPFMEGESFRLVKYRMPLKIGQFGIKEPKYSKQYRRRKIDLAIIPMIGTDPTLRRVGFGRGMYDRFYEREQKNIKKIVFISRVFCFSHNVVTNHYDIPADTIVTPEKILSSRRVGIFNKLRV